MLYHRIEDPSSPHPELEPDLITATPAAFRRQLRHLARGYHPVAAGELVAALAGQHRLPPRAVLITFDDGYRDFKEVAWPILRELRLPAVLFVTTGFVDQPRRIFWWDALWQMLTRTGRRWVDLPEDGGRPVPLQAADVIGGFRTIAAWLKERTPAERRAAMDYLAEHLGVVPEPTEAVLSWSDLRELARSGVAIAAHTQSHELLDQVDPPILQAEIEGSRDDIVRELGSGTPLFAYPNGNFNRAAMEAVEAAGFAAAFTTVHGASDLRRANPFALRRDDGGTSLLRFAVKLLGPVTAYRNRRHALPAYAQARGQGRSSVVGR